MDHNPGDESLTGLERSLMIKAMTLKRLVGDHRLFKSEIKTLEKAAQTISVLQRKEFLRKEIPRMAEEIATLNAALTKMMANGGDQLDPSGKYHKMAEKLLWSKYALLNVYNMSI
ncbi:hypothetical protein FRACYDRAFT_263306 [Fragilariopsis cylindrus CCMP1102]|uniref:Uncharacterized protein n=1 Tax=Fragilariopsis cylindrus CCMP1102 TaxID=635003 RepID=A0A1E7F0U0_9STRA|nr:hypothetical protein FRACYDRAFT_263306 [Fragilariopsis cylindrus CCMP1102]|eukprot:OEU11747.1 hypothetical protein FRACYDRAFT_263306 [Fragilariopsis cylindrus CCMP1102]